MVTLKKGGITTPKTPVTPKPEEWVKAKEFIPGQPYNATGLFSNNYI